MKKWLRKKLWNLMHSTEPQIAVNLVSESRIQSDGMNISIYNATGGTIVEFRRYDRVKDRSDNKMYVVPAGEDFPEKFANIVSMEMMR